MAKVKDDLDRDDDYLLDDGFPLIYNINETF